MKEGKGKNIIIILLLVIVIALLTFIALLLTNTISFGTNTKNNNSGTEVSDNGEVKETEKDEDKSYNAEEYIELEDVVFNSKVSTKKVAFKNLSDGVTRQFYEEQQKVIDNIHVSDSEMFDAKYNLKYFINNNILSVLYTIEETDAIGTCAKMMAVTNIDLKNNKVVSEEELLKMAGTSYNDIVEKYYEKELDSWSKLNQMNGHEVAYYEVTFEDFKNNKSKYVSEGVEKIPNIIYTYIEDGTIKYDYYTISVGTLFHAVGKGGCFNWVTEELGKYNY